MIEAFGPAPCSICNIPNKRLYISVQEYFYPPLKLCKSKYNVITYEYPLNNAGTEIRKHLIGLFSNEMHSNINWCLIPLKLFNKMKLYY